MKTVLREKFIVLNVYIIKFKRLKIKELSTPLGYNHKEVGEGNYKDKNRSCEIEDKNATESTNKPNTSCLRGLRKLTALVR